MTLTDWVEWAADALDNPATNRPIAAERLRSAIVEVHARRVARARAGYPGRAPLREPRPRVPIDPVYVEHAQALAEAYNANERKRPQGYLLGQAYDRGYAHGLVDGADAKTPSDEPSCPPSCATCHGRGFTRVRRDHTLAPCPGAVEPLYLSPQAFTVAALVAEVARLREQVDTLQGANNREVERRRKAEGDLDAARRSK